MQTTQICQSAEQTQEQSEFADLHLSKPATGAGRWWRRRMRRGYRGQSLVEFAISLPFLIFLVLALVELGFLIRGHLTVTNAVREGVRTATQAGDYLPINSGYYLDRLGPQTIANWGNDYSPNDMRVPPGNDADNMLVSNMSTALQEKLPDAYLLMTYRADSSDYGSYSLVNKPGDRWGVVYFPKDNNLEAHYWSWGTPNPYQRIFQQITNTLVMTVTDYSSTPTKTIVMPYIRQGWIAGVMNNDIFTFTVGLPFTLPTTVLPGPSTYTIKFQSDAYTTVSDKVVAPPGDPYATSSNLVQVRRATSPCKGPDPIDLTGKFSGVLSRTVTSGDNMKSFCGTNDPNLHVTPTTPGFEKPLDPDPRGLYLNVAAARKASFIADPWYPSWRYPGGFPCDISKPTSQPGDANYYNKPSKSPDWLGVRLDYRHYWMTSWFGIPSLNLTDKAVKILEPVPRPGYDWKCNL